MWNLTEFSEWRSWIIPIEYNTRDENNNSFSYNQFQLYLGKWNPNDSSIELSILYNTVTTRMYHIYIFYHFHQNRFIKDMFVYDNIDILFVYFQIHHWNEPCHYYIAMLWVDGLVVSSFNFWVLDWSSNEMSPANQHAWIDWETV